MTTVKAIPLLTTCFFLSFNTFSQDAVSVSDCEPPATVIVFRTFNMISILFNYNLFFGDSSLGRIKTHDVVVIRTHDPATSFHTNVKAPSLNADKRTNYQRIKSLKYPITLKRGEVYLVKCGFLNQSVFDYPRQPTIRVIKNDEVGEYLNKRFVKKNVKRYLYSEWLVDNGLDKLSKKKK